MATTVILLATFFATLFQNGMSYTPEALADQILSLPGAEALTIPFRHFSGYIPVTGKSTKNMHYWLVSTLFLSNKHKIGINFINPMINRSNPLTTHPLTR